MIRYISLKNYYKHQIKKKWFVKYDILTTPIPSNAKMAVPKKSGHLCQSVMYGTVFVDGTSWNTYQNVIVMQIPTKKFAIIENGARYFRLRIKFIRITKGNIINMYHLTFNSKTYSSITWKKNHMFNIKDWHKQWKLPYKSIRCRNLIHSITTII